MWRLNEISGTLIIEGDKAVNYAKWHRDYNPDYFKVRLSAREYRTPKELINTTGEDNASRTY